MRIERLHWAAKIRQANHKTVAAIIEQGKTLQAAKDALEFGEWQKMFEKNEVPLTLPRAQQLMRIARDPRLSKTQNFESLPAVVATLDVLTNLSDEEFERRLADRTIHKGMICADITGNRIKPQTTQSETPLETLNAEFETCVDEYEDRLRGGEITKAQFRKLPGVRKLKGLLA
jgi:hypothetical protein